MFKVNPTTNNKGLGTLTVTDQSGDVINGPYIFKSLKLRDEYAKFFKKRIKYMDGSSNNMLDEILDVTGILLEYQFNGTVIEFTPKQAMMLHENAVSLVIGEIDLYDDHVITIKEEVKDIWVLDVLNKDDISVLSEPCVFRDKEVCNTYANIFEVAFKSHYKDQHLSDDDIVKLLDVPPLLNFFNLPSDRVEKIKQQYI